MGLFGRKSGHPMADPKSAQQVLDDLPKNDNLKTVQEISGWIESVREDAGLRLDDMAGLEPDLLRGGWRVGRDLSVNYIVAAGG